MANWWESWTNASELKASCLIKHFIIVSKIHTFWWKLISRLVVKYSYHVKWAPEERPQGINKSSRTQSVLHFSTSHSFFENSLFSTLIC